MERETDIVQSLDLDPVGSDLWRTPTGTAVRASRCGPRRLGGLSWRVEVGMMTISHSPKPAAGRGCSPLTPGPSWTSLSQWLSVTCVLEPGHLCPTQDSAKGLSFLPHLSGGACWTCITPEALPTQTWFLSLACTGPISMGLRTFPAQFFSCPFCLLPSPSP